MIPGTSLAIQQLPIKIVTLTPLGARMLTALDSRACFASLQHLGGWACFACASCVCESCQCEIALRVLRVTLC